MACSSNNVSGIKGTSILNVFLWNRRRRPKKAINFLSRSVTSYGLIHEPAKVKENSVPPEVDFKLNRDKIFFVYLRVRKPYLEK